MEKVILDEQLDKQIENLWFEGENLVYNKKYEEAKDLMEKTWQLLPESKENFSPSYHISENLTRAFIGLQQFDEAKKWLEIHKKNWIW